MVGTYYLVSSHVIHQQIKDFFRLILWKNIFISFKIIKIIFAFKSVAGLILYLTFTLCFIFRLPQILFTFTMCFEIKVPYSVVFHGVVTVFKVTVGTNPIKWRVVLLAKFNWNWWWNTISNIPVKVEFKFKKSSITFLAHCSLKQRKSMNKY